MEVYWVVAGFILFDILTGLLKAFKNGKLNSSILREGLFHKLSEAVALVGSGLIETACAYVNLGVEIPVLNAVATYICVMELVSCIENLCEVNPALSKLFAPYLEKLNK